MPALLARLHWSRAAFLRRSICLRASVTSRIRTLWCFFFLFVRLHISCSAAEPWQTALESMPLEPGVAELNSSNAVQMMLAAFQSNHVVKGLIFMPGATDEFYFFHRARAQLPKGSLTLLDAVNTLSSQTRIQPTFRAPLLLLHTDEDQLEPIVKSESAALLEKLQSTRFVPHALYYDRDWDYIQPILRKTLKVEILPARYSADSWHFYRHCFAAWNLNGFETLEALVFAGKTRCSIQKQGGLSLRRTRVVFEPDKRASPATANRRVAGRKP